MGHSTKIEKVNISGSPGAVVAAGDANVSQSLNINGNISQENKELIRDLEQLQEKLTQANQVLIANAVKDLKEAVRANNQPKISEILQNWFNEGIKSIIKKVGVGEKLREFLRIN